MCKSPLTPCFWSFLEQYLSKTHLKWAEIRVILCIRLPKNFGLNNSYRFRKISKKHGFWSLFFDKEICKKNGNLWFVNCEAQLCLTWNLVGLLRIMRAIWGLTFRATTVPFRALQLLLSNIVEFWRKILGKWVSLDYSIQRFSVVLCKELHDFQLI